MADEVKQTKEKTAAAATPAIEAGATDAAKPEVKAATRKRKERKSVPYGIMYVQATFNNTIVTITDPAGNVISWSSAGACGFKGSRKNTPFAAQIAAENAAKNAVAIGMRQVDVMINGPGAGREAALRALQSTGLRVNNIKDVTPIPHNGCRPPKRRRV
jgi:small subunit ribosomal protein S11